MDDDEKADLARKGIRAAELLEPGKIADGVKESMKEGVEDAVLRGAAALGRLTGKDRSPARRKAVAAVDLYEALDEFDAADRADFEQRLREAATRKAQEPPAPESTATDLAELRRHFPEASRELALLIFNCVDLLEDLSDDAEGQPPAELERREKLLTRVAELLAPNAGEALQSFVAHVVQISRQHRKA